MSDKIKFILNGCDISFVAEAPCACGICSLEADGYKNIDEVNPEISIDYDSIKKITDCACHIMEV